MKTPEQIIEWINDKLKKLDKDEKKASNNPDIESNIESIDNIHTQRMLLNNLLKYIDDAPPQSEIKWEQLGDNNYIANYTGYTLKVEKIIKYVWWWRVFPKPISGYHSIPLSCAITPEATKEQAMQQCENHLKEIGVLK